MRAIAVLLISVVLSLVVSNAMAFLSCSCNTVRGYSVPVVNISFTSEYSADFFWAGVYPSDYTLIAGSSCYSSTALSVTFPSYSIDGVNSTYLVSPEKSNYYECILFDRSVEYLTPGQKGTCKMIESYHFTCPQVVTTSMSGGGVAAIVVGVVLGIFFILFVVTVILCLVRRAQERKSYKRVDGGASNSSTVNLSDAAMQTNPNMMSAPGFAQTSLPPVSYMQTTGSAYSPYMAAPPSVYYVPNQNGTMTAMYMTNQPMMMTAQPQVYVTTPQVQQ
jgi:hypothetical protein